MAGLTMLMLGLCLGTVSAICRIAVRLAVWAARLMAHTLKMTVRFARWARDRIEVAALNRRIARSAHTA